MNNSIKELMEVHQRDAQGQAYLTQQPASDACGSYPSAGEEPAPGQGSVTVRSEMGACLDAAKYTHKQDHEQSRSSKELAPNGSSVGCEDSAVWLPRNGRGFPGEEEKPPLEASGDGDRGTDVAEDGAARRAERRRILRNVLVVSLAFLLLYTAYFGAQNLQSSVNASGGLGTHALVVMDAVLIFGSFLLPATVIRWLGCKWTLVAGIAIYAPYICAQFAASSATLLPSAILIGLGAGPLWCAKCTYLTASARRYAALTAQQDEQVQVRFFGVFFTMYPIANILGNAISSLVLTTGSDAEAASGVVCGADFCPAQQDASVNPNLARPPLQQLYVLYGALLACVTAAAAGVMILLDPLPSCPREQAAPQESGLRLLTASARLLADPLHCLMLPVCVFFGVAQSFISADFTQAYVSCSWGIPHIGYVLMCYGGATCLCSAAISWLSHSASQSLVSVCLVLYAPAIAVLFFWRPDPAASTATFFLIVAFWGFIESGFLVINAVFGVLFRGREQAAYSNLRTAESVGCIASFALSPAFCTRVKLAILAALLAVSAVCYWAAGWLARHRAANSYWLPDKQAGGSERVSCKKMCSKADDG